MVAHVQMTVARCTECSSILMQTPRNGDMYYVCCDCNKIFKAIGRGQLDNEILLSDNIYDKVEFNEKF